MILIAVIGKRFDGDAATRVEQSNHFQILGIHQFHQIFHNDVHAILVKIAMVAEAEEIEFQALALHHAHARDVVDDDVAKIRLTGLGAQRGEFWTIQRHNIFIFRMFILKHRLTTIFLSGIISIIL